MGVRRNDRNSQTRWGLVCAQCLVQLHHWCDDVVPRLFWRGSLSYRYSCISVVTLAALLLIQDCPGCFSSPFCWQPTVPPLNPQVSAKNPTLLQCRRTLEHLRGTEGVEGKEVLGQGGSMQDKRPGRATQASFPPSHHPAALSPGCTHRLAGQALGVLSQPPRLDVLQLAGCEKLTSACKTISSQPACILGFRWRTSVDWWECRTRAVG